MEPARQIGREPPFDNGSRLAYVRAVTGLADFLAKTRRSLPVPPTPESIFEALDGRAVDIDGEACAFEIFGVLDEAGRCWVQLAVRSTRPRMMTLALRQRPDEACDLVSGLDGP
jgi:hypothetical protein